MRCRTLRKATLRGRADHWRTPNSSSEHGTVTRAPTRSWSGGTRGSRHGSRTRCSGPEREQREQLMEAVNGMREEDRLVIGYRYFLGLSERETAATLHVPAGTVKSRLARALSRLRTALEEREVEPAPEEGNRG